LKSARSACRFWIVAGWLLAGAALGVHAEEPKGRVAKPASTAAKPAPDAASSSDAKADPESDADRSDDEFLEFLGSVDSDADEDWLDYLAQTDILKVAKAKKKAQAAESKPAPDKASK
jgi:hypothetical protein